MPKLPNDRICDCSRRLRKRARSLSSKRIRSVLREVWTSSADLTLAHGSKTSTSLAMGLGTSALVFHQDLPKQQAGAALLLGASQVVRLCTAESLQQSLLLLAFEGGTCSLELFISQQRPVDARPQLARFISAAAPLRAAPALQRLQSESVATSRLRRAHQAVHVFEVRRDGLEVPLPCKNSCLAADLAH